MSEEHKTPATFIRTSEQLHSAPAGPVSGHVDPRGVKVSSQGPQENQERTYSSVHWIRTPFHFSAITCNLSPILTMITRLIASSSARPAFQRAAASAVQKSTPSTAAATRSSHRALSSESNTPTLAAAAAPTMDDYEKIMGRDPAAVASWIEDVVMSATSDVCDLTGWSSAETTSTTMGLEDCYIGAASASPFDYDKSIVAGYRTRCSFDAADGDCDSTMPGVDSPANEV